MKNKNENRYGNILKEATERANREKWRKEAELAKMQEQLKKGKTQEQKDKEVFLDEMMEKAKKRNREKKYFGV